VHAPTDDTTKTSTAVRSTRPSLSPYVVDDFTFTRAELLAMREDGRPAVR
jgi:hypothetical protein